MRPSLVAFPLMRLRISSACDRIISSVSLSGLIQSTKFVSQRCDALLVLSLPIGPPKVRLRAGLPLNPAQRRRTITMVSSPARPELLHSITGCVVGGADREIHLARRLRDGSSAGGANFRVPSWEWVKIDGTSHDGIANRWNIFSTTRSTTGPNAKLWSFTRS